VLAAGSQTQLGSPGAPLRFSSEERPEDGLLGRFLQLDEKDAFELSFWCGTCPSLFRRLEGANRSLVIPMQKGDYFAHEQLEHRGPDGFWGLPHFPETQYYRGGTGPQCPCALTR
jgi:hypothetical protein